MAQIQQDEPQRLRRLNSAVPRDLEAIVHKCLEKKEAHRYATARDLADDLGRFLDGKPVRARAVRSWERGWKWAKRRPVVAGLTATVLMLVVLGVGASLSLAAWALRERDKAEHRLDEVEQANRRRAEEQVNQLGTAVPEAVPGLLKSLADDRAAVLPRLRELWNDENKDEKTRMRAGLALVGGDPEVQWRLAEWMLKADDPREVLLVRQVLADNGADLAAWLWSQADDPGTERRFRALAALALFDPDNPKWSGAAPAAVDFLLQTNPLHRDLWLPALFPVRGRLIPGFEDAFRRAPAVSRRLAAATVLADYRDHPEALAILACDADSEQFLVLRPALEQQAAEVAAALGAKLKKKPGGKEAETDRIARAKRQANAAAALVALGQPDAAWELLKHSREPDARTYLIHALAPRHADPQVVVGRLEQEKDAGIRAGLILALGEFTREQLTSVDRDALTSRLLDWYRKDADPGIHSAVDWLLRHGKDGPAARPFDWGKRLELEKIDAELAGNWGPAGHAWYVNGQGQTFACFTKPQPFQMGSTKETDPDREDDEILHKQTIGRSFAIATKPVTKGQWKKFMEAMKKRDLAIPHAAYTQYVDKYAPDDDCPIVEVTWYEAAMYCRWLSEEEHIDRDQMVYPEIKEILACADGKKPLKLKEGRLDLTGYRLPTEAEWEYACRADTMTQYNFGGALELLPRHAWFIENSKSRTWPAGQKMPNGFGLFDMHGNVWNWCDNGYRRHTSKDMEDEVDERDINRDRSRVLRGGPFGDRPLFLRSSYRANDAPTVRSNSVGLRVARTFTAE